MWDVHAIDRFQSRGQQLCKLLGIKESFNMWKVQFLQGHRSHWGDKCFCIHPESLLSRIRSKQSRSLRMCWSSGFKYQSSVEDLLDCIWRPFFDTIGSHGILLWFLDQRSLLYQHNLSRNWNHWWREKLGEEETCYHIPSSDCWVFDRLCTFHGLLHSCCISNQREYRYEPLLWSRECVSIFVWLQSMFKSTCLRFPKCPF